MLCGGTTVALPGCLHATRSSYAVLFTISSSLSLASFYPDRRLPASPSFCPSRCPSRCPSTSHADISPSTSAVTLDLGLDVHLDLSPSEAASYASRRADVLRKKKEAMARREERLRWEVGQVSAVLQ